MDNCLFNRTWKEHLSSGIGPRSRHYGPKAGSPEKPTTKSGQQLPLLGWKWWGASTKTMWSAIRKTRAMTRLLVIQSLPFSYSKPPFPSAHPHSFQNHLFSLSRSVTLSLSLSLYIYVYMQLTRESCLYRVLFLRKFGVPQSVHFVQNHLKWNQEACKIRNRYRTLRSEKLPRSMRNSWALLALASISSWSVC